jgi:peptidoglycan/xylan/chitin deacetylase (PgdA/CDA1 family)
MEIGDHTMQHVRLTRLTPAEIQHEINAAQTLLQARLGVAPTTFAYPFGAMIGSTLGFEPWLNPMRGQGDWVPNLGSGGPPFGGVALVFQITDRRGWIGFWCPWGVRDPLPVPRMAGRDCG